MDINKLTIGQVKEIAAMFPQSASNETLLGMIGLKVIIRTYSAGVWFGTLSEKAGNEVILKDARRMWKWKAKQGISLSSVALHGIDAGGSRIEPPVPAWLEAIEIIPCSQEAILSLEGAPNATA